MGNGWVHDCVANLVEAVVVEASIGYTSKREVRGEAAGHGKSSKTDSTQLSMCGGDIRFTGRYGDNHTGVFVEVKTLNPYNAASATDYMRAAKRHGEWINEKNQGSSIPFNTTVNQVPNAVGRGRGRGAFRGRGAGRAGRTGGRGGRGSSIPAMLSWAPTAPPIIQAPSVEKLIAAVRGHRDAAAAAKLNMDHVPFIIQRSGGLSNTAYGFLVKIFAGRRELDERARRMYRTSNYLQYVVDRLAVETANQDYYNIKNCMSRASRKLNIEPGILSAEAEAAFQQRTRLSAAASMDLFAQQGDDDDYDEDQAEQICRDDEEHDEILAKQFYAMYLPGNADMVKTTSGEWYKLTDSNDTAMFFNADPNAPQPQAPQYGEPPGYQAAADVRQDDIMEDDLCDYSSQAATEVYAHVDDVATAEVASKDETAAAGAAAVPAATSDKVEISFCSRCGRRNDAAVSLTHRNTGGGGAVCTCGTSAAAGAAADGGMS